MKKLRFISMMCLLALFVVSLVGCKKEEVNNNGNNNDNGGSGGGGSAQTGYVDLGLPSGTKWKDSNENGNGTGFYTFDEAVSAFGDKLPTKEQFDELRVYCTWEWQNNGGYKVTGPNGNSIVLPAAGICLPWEGEVYYVGSGGFYWSSTPIDSECAWNLIFYSNCVTMADDDLYGRNLGCAIRLVQD